MVVELWAFVYDCWLVDLETEATLTGEADTDCGLLFSCVELLVRLSFLVFILLIR